MTARRIATLAVTLAFLLAAGTLAALRFWPSSPLPQDARADRVLVLKEARTLELLRNGKLLKRYTIALGSHPRGHRLQFGDGRTPEGLYRIDMRNSRSHFHLALLISYPYDADRRRARERGVSPGSDIMIHGIRNGLGWIGPLHRLIDWTNSCIAVTDREIEEIWRAVAVGTPVEIRP